VQLPPASGFRRYRGVARTPSPDSPVLISRERAAAPDDYSPPPTAALGKLFDQRLSSRSIFISADPTSSTRRSRVVVGKRYKRAGPLPPSFPERSPLPPDSQRSFSPTSELISILRRGSVWDALTLKEEEIRRMDAQRRSKRKASRKARVASEGNANHQESLAPSLNTNPIQADRASIGPTISSTSSTHSDDQDAAHSPPTSLPDDKRGTSIPRKASHSSDNRARRGEPHVTLSSSNVRIRQNSRKTGT
jgi:hypothetical protein